MRNALVFLVLLANISFAARTRVRAQPTAAPITVTRQTLAAVDTNVDPWRDLDAEQSYTYIGATPREITLGLGSADHAKIPTRLKTRAERELTRIREKLNLASAQFEMWPTYDDWNSLSWMVARYRETPRHNWKWLDQSFVSPNQRDFAGSQTGMVFPDVLDPAQAKDADQIFNHYPADLYQRPVFENILWMNTEQTQVLAAWLPYGEPTGPSQGEHPAPGANEVKMQALCKQQKCVAVNVNPPARLNDTPVTYVVTNDASGTTFPKDIDWIDENRTKAKPIAQDLLIAQWPSDLEEKITDYVAKLSGVKAIYSPVTGKKIDFKKQGSGQLDNQLWDTANYLVKASEQLGYLPVRDSALGYTPKHYAAQGDRFTVRLQRFDWDGIAQANVIATIHGKQQGPHRKLVVASAHFDKAIAEDTYASSHGKTRETTPGADDNASGVAALLIGMEQLAAQYRDQAPNYDIEFVFDTGEEFPAGTAGARKYVSNELLNKELDVVVNVNLDMIGYRNRGDRAWQLSPGNSDASWVFAEKMLGIADALNAQLVAQRREPWEAQVLHPWSLHRQLDQTSGGIWDWAGYDTVTINEHLNLERRLNPVYHQSNDLKVDADYAGYQTKVLIEALAHAAR